jgi:hypothetical protein
MVIIAIAHTKKGGGFFSRLIIAMTTSSSMSVKPLRMIASSLM